ncbi:transposase [Cutibacterium equinum]|uniref:Transposase n=1 Tax=Cutibacterium equinum TaxID=3016342 RepID=A0ABY7QVL8_9ACTN|nr:transposase [Cutibacterium equinum]WCC79123.1 transposase [Cutibacterium equinum]
MITVCRASSRAEGTKIMTRLIVSIRYAVVTSLVEVAGLVWALTIRCDDVPAFFDHHGPSNGPTEAINKRLEHLRGTAFGLCNLIHYIVRSLLKADGFKPDLHPRL